MMVCSKEKLLLNLKRIPLSDITKKFGYIYMEVLIKCRLEKYNVMEINFKW